MVKKPAAHKEVVKTRPVLIAVEEDTPPNKRDLRVVGIGASAGGLEALEQFFSHAPSDKGLAFVVVQHLDPTGHTSMPEILARFTRMPVCVATEGMKVAANSVYLIPPNKNMGIANGALFLEEPSRLPGLRLPVDFFFRSLAREKGPDAIGIILSGTGTDGTLGIRAIKAEMGTVLVQDPASAKYDGMPRSAIDTGLVDFVLNPDEMPGKLVLFVEHLKVNGARFGATAAEAREPVQQIFSILRARTGHDFSRYKQATVRRRLQRRMSVNQINDINSYASFLTGSEKEANALLKDLLISVTGFFRDPGAFEALKRHVKDLLQNKSRGADVRVWIAGCATGEETYSVAIIISECIMELRKNLQVQIYSTDIDAEALQAARSGVYPANIATDLSPERLKNYFIKENHSYRVKKELREGIVFAPQNFIKDPPFSRIDLICCRNLLIYLDGDVQKQLLPLLHYALKPGGILFLGPSETIGGATDLFTALDKKWRIFKRVDVVVPPERLRFPAAFSPSIHQLVGEASPETNQVKIPALTEKIFLDNYAPTFAVIDEKYRLIYVRGRTGKYLEIASGQPNWTIVDMAREGLRTEIGSAIYRAVNEKKTIVHQGVRVKTNGDFLTLNLTVAPLNEPGIPSGLLMIVFQETGPAIEEGKVRRGKGQKLADVLENELKLTRENLQNSIEELQATNEELKSANEELQSNNEELQSTNEELDTSREELQSLNEELTTVNAELQDKNELLVTANDDLKNFLNRTDIAIIFVDEELKIRSYTPAAKDIFNIREIDIGRPIDEITSRLTYQNIAEAARTVLRTLTPAEKEVERNDQHWYTMRILPYLTVQNAVAGVVISFLDIDKQKKAVNSLAETNRQLQEALEDQKRTASQLRLLAAVVTDSNDAIMTQDLEGNILTWNRSAERMYGYTEAEVRNMSSTMLSPEEDRSKLLEFLKNIELGKEAHSIEVRRRTRDGRTIDVWLTATRLVDEQKQPVAIATTESDITERKKTEQLKNDFIGMVSHEMRTPLTVIIGSLETALDKRCSQKDARELLKEADLSAISMAAILDNLLELSRHQAGRLILEKKPVNVASVVQKVAQRIRHQYPKSFITLELPDGLPQVKTDPVRLELVIFNLMDNAVKYSPEGSEVRTFARKENNSLIVGVSDKGPGISASNQKKLIQSFEQLAIRKRRPMQGVGLGLKVCRTLVEAHGGRIWIESEPGRGSTFLFTIPIEN